ncbi:putative phospholipase [Rhodotorula diobovata]|uniref:Acyl-protein thioesterase 1 n=1 Tax=Rhodotorula diobovata TaxID=5288 RepID=A0A5C5FT29_9BASI|nr:putative phospholipase [Rhodotorula diobovata]
MKERQEPNVPLRWVFRALFALLAVYGVMSWFRPPLGVEVQLAANVPGDDVEVLGIGRHSGTVIVVHGLGANAAQNIPLVSRLRQKLFQVSFVLPSAEPVPLSAFGGQNHSAWFDVYDLEPAMDAPLPKREDEQGIKKAVERIHALAQRELDKGIEPQRIVLGGFSQGCATALLAAISSKEKLGGVICLSGWLPLSYKIEKVGRRKRHPMQAEHAHQMPVFWGHGVADPTVHYLWAEQSLDHLADMGFRDIEAHTYDGLEHTVSWAEEKDLEAWLQRILPPT